MSSTDRQVEDEGARTALQPLGYGYQLSQEARRRVYMGVLGDLALAGYDVELLALELLGDES